MKTYSIRCDTDLVQLTGDDYYVDVHGNLTIIRKTDCYNQHTAHTVAKGIWNYITEDPLTVNKEPIK